MSLRRRSAQPLGERALTNAGWRAGGTATSSDSEESVPSTRIRQSSTGGSSYGQVTEVCSE